MLSLHLNTASRRALLKAHLLRLCFGAVALALPSVAKADAGEPPAYRDDRSTPEAVVKSLYNAVERKEYLRAWSYFRDEPGRPSLADFTKGYADTEHVKVKVGTPVEEGAAGSIYYSLPAAVEATAKDESKQVFTGCYQLRLAQPAVQETPPFQPLGIVKGTFAKASGSFKDATGTCDQPQ